MRRKKKGRRYQVTFSRKSAKESKARIQSIKFPIHSLFTEKEYKEEENGEEPGEAEAEEEQEKDKEEEKEG